MKKVIRVFTVIIAAAVSAVMALVCVGDALLPPEIVSYSDGDISFGKIYGVATGESSQVDFRSDVPVSGVAGEIKLFGAVPVKSADVEQLSEKKVAVSGECFGIKLYTDGIIVVGTRDVDTPQGRVNPANAAGIEKGDIIISINGVNMYSAAEVEEAFNSNNGEEYEVKIRRNGNYKTIPLTPVYSPSEGRYKVGVWVRDSTAGIGTMTFYNPENGTLAALGHPITDVDTNEIMPLLNGEAVRATVTKLYQSEEGDAGSICCEFTNDVIGTLTENSEWGIYGKYAGGCDESRLYIVASPQEVERGAAQILCTVDGDGPAFYDVEITRISYNSASGKNLVIRVTDKNLTEKTGGIIQGMSGSPIIQNGKLVGALTHVVVDNPGKGYGVFAEKMVAESEKLK